MTVSLALNANNDIYVDSHGNLATVSDLAACEQDCACAMKAQLGEETLNTTRGVPTLQTIWQQWQPDQFESFARKILLTVPGVTAVTSFTLTRLGQVATYAAGISTIYGPTTISGSLNQ